METLPHSIGDHPVERVAREKLNELIRQKAKVRKNLPPDLALMRYAMKHHRAKFDDETFWLLEEAIYKLARFPTSALRLYEPGGRVRVEPEEVEARHPISAGLFLVRNLYPIAEDVIEEAKAGRLRILPTDYDHVFVDSSDASAPDEADDARSSSRGDSEESPPDPPYHLYDETYRDSRKHDEGVLVGAALLVAALATYGIGALIFAGNPAFLILAALLLPVAWRYSQKIDGKKKYKRWVERWKHGINIDGNITGAVDRSEWRDDWCSPMIRSARYQVDWVDFVDRDVRDEDCVFRWAGEKKSGYALKRHGRYVAVVEINT
jgi:hypothetical protein